MTPPTAIVSSATGDLVVLLQDAQASGGFRALPSQALSGTPTALLADDFDRDGVADLAVTLGTAQSGSLLLLRGQLRSGVLSYVQTSRTDGGRDPRALGDADFNHDGVLDVVSGPYIYYGPDYTKRSEIELAESTSPSTSFGSTRRITALTSSPFTSARPEVRTPTTSGLLRLMASSTVRVRTRQAGPHLSMLQRVLG